MAVVSDAELRQRVNVDTLAARLKYAIDMRGTSADRLDARLVPPSKKYVAYIANGRNETPAMHVVVQLAELLDVDLTWLAAGKGTPPTSADSATVATAPVWSRDPDWPAERDLAIARRPDGMPEYYIYDMGERVVGGGSVRPTWSMIVDLAKVFWHAELEAKQRTSALPPSGVMSSVPPAPASEEQTIQESARRR